MMALRRAAEKAACAGLLEGVVNQSKLPVRLFSTAAVLVRTSSQTDTQYEFFSSLKAWWLARGFNQFV